MKTNHYSRNVDRLGETVCWSIPVLCFWMYFV